MSNHQNKSSTMQSESTKTKQQFVSENLSDDRGKRTKKRRQTSESSSSQQQPEPKREEELMELEILKDRVQRRIIKDEMEDIKYLLMTARDEIDLPQRAELEELIEKLKAIQSYYKKAAGKTTTKVTNDEFKRRLLEINGALENLKEQQRKLPATVSSLSGQTAANGPTLVDQDQGSLQPQEQSLATFISSLENEVYGPENIEVGVSSFQGLREAVTSNTWGTTPDQLEPIATRIKLVRPANKEYSITPVLVYAAIKEMQDTKSNNLNLDMLRKWRATLNRAKQEGFQVADAEDILLKNFSTYCMLAFRCK